MKIFVLIKNAKGHENIWRIIDEFMIGGQNTYKVFTRTTCAFIEKDMCMADGKSTVIRYVGNRTIDIEPSEVDIEGQVELHQHHQKCRRCLYYESCEDALDNLDCEFFCGVMGDEALKSNWHIDMDYLEQDEDVVLYNRIDPPREVQEEDYDDDINDKAEFMKYCTRCLEGIYNGCMINGKGLRECPYGYYPYSTLDLF